jgi:hypothetical protein
VAYVAKVDRFAAFSEEEEAVKFLEEDGGRLVDGAENGLAGRGQLLEEGDNGPGGLLSISSYFII